MIARHVALRNAYRAYPHSGLNPHSPSGYFISSPIRGCSRSALRFARLVRRRRSRRWIPGAESLLDLRLLALGLQAHFVGFASAGAHVEKGEDGRDDDADCDYYDEDDEAVGTAGGVVVGTGRVALVKVREGRHCCC